MEKMVSLLRENKIIILLFLFAVFAISCKSSENKIKLSSYNNFEYFIKDYLLLPYVQGYIEDYDVFGVNVNSVKPGYLLITIYPFTNKVTLNSSDFIEYDLFPQSYREVDNKTFFIDFKYMRPSNMVYDKLLEKNKIDSTYIWVEQGKIPEEEGIIINKLDDSIMSQKYLVKIEKGKFELIYDWFGN